MSQYLRKITFPLLVSLLILTFFSLAISATTIPQYRTKIEQTYELLEDLLYPEEEASDTKILAEQRQTIRQIQITLPKTDKIELKDGSFDVDNSWLYDKLQRFESEQLDSPNREKLINESLDKLAALEAKIDELENQKSAGRTKDEDKRKLGEILKRAEYQKPEKKEESAVQRTISNFFAWLRDVFPRPNFGDASPGASQGLTSTLQIIVFLIVIAAIGFLLYRFAPVFFKNFRNRDKNKNETRVILGETLAADETSQHLFAEAENLARAGDLRAAIRKGYIALLCELSDRKVIGLARHKTNHDYLRDLRKRENLYSDMRGLTASFERHWYGLDSTAKEDWEDFRKLYKETVSKKF